MTILIVSYATVDKRDGVIITAERRMFEAIRDPRDITLQLAEAMMFNNILDPISKIEGATFISSAIQKKYILEKIDKIELGSDGFYIDFLRKEKDSRRVRIEIINTIMYIERDPNFAKIQLPLNVGVDLIDEYLRYNHKEIKYKYPRWTKKLMDTSNIAYRH